MAEIPKPNRAAKKRDIALSRERMARELSGLRYELDLPAKLKSSFRHQPMIWIGIVVVVGLIVAVAPARRKKVYIHDGSGKKKERAGGESLLEAGALVGALKFAATLLRPVVVNFLAAKMRGYANSRGRRMR